MAHSISRRTFLAGLSLAPMGMAQAGGSEMQTLQLNWGYVADTVMGGVSRGQMTTHGDAVQLHGTVSLENNGGFIQMAADLSPRGTTLDASAFSAFAFQAKGNGEVYEMRLRTTDLSRPWQGYKAQFTAGPDWQTVTLPFSSFEPSRTEVPFNPSKLRRLGILAIGRVFEADVYVKDMRLVP